MRVCSGRQHQLSGVAPAAAAMLAYVRLTADAARLVRIGTPVAKSARTFLIIVGVMLACGVSHIPAALASCSLNASTYTCSGSTANASGFGVGTGSSDNNKTLNVGAGATISETNFSSISLGNNNTINIGAGAQVTTTTTNGNTVAGGGYNTGPDTVQFGANNTMTIEAGAIVQAVAGATGTPNPNAEAINVQGFGNTIINYGTLYSNTSAAIFLQNTSSIGGSTALTVPGVAGTYGTLIFNYGTITAAPGPNSARITQAIAETPGTAQNVFFANEVGATVNGNLVMGNGNDTVELFSGSTITGNLSAGSGTDALILNADSSLPPGTINGQLSGFNTLTKVGTGEWVITGSLSTTKPSGLAAVVQQGTLTLTGNSSAFTGSMTVNGGATLQLGNGGTSGSLAKNITDNGTVAFNRADSVTFANVISGSGQIAQNGTGTTTLTAANTYSGGTIINSGTLATGADSALGVASGPLTFNGGTFQFNASYDLSATRPITIDAPGGTINTQGFTSTVAQGMTGPGALAKTGSGNLILTGENSYAGGTTIAAGTLQLGNGGAAGSIIGDVADNGTLIFDRSDAPTFAGMISGAGAVAQIGPGTTILTADNTYAGGTTITAGTLQLGDGGASGSIIGDVADNGTLTFDRSDVVTFAGLISGAGAVNQIGSGTTLLTANNVYSGQTNVEAGTLAAGVENAFSPKSVHIVDPDGTLDLMGFDQELPGIENAGTIFTHGDPNTQLIVNGSYVGNNGLLVLNTYLASDDSPSDKLVINGGTATGTTGIRIDNVGGPGAQTFENGIPVVIAENGATTAEHAFELVGEVRAGAFTYDLYRGGVEGTDPQSFFLRNSFVISGQGQPEPEPPFEPTPGENLPAPTPPGIAPQAVPEGVPDPPEPATAQGAGLSVVPTNPFPTDPPPEPLVAGVYPIIGPELATDGVVQPIARQMGLTMLGTLHERIGDTLTIENAGPDAEGWGQSGWARFFGQQIDNRYQSYVEPSTTGRLFGVQAGFDLWRGSFIPGHRDAAGVYFAYGNAAMDVNGLITNTAATGYVAARTGTVNLYAYSGGAYWTHYGPGGWYLDTVLQGTAYTGSAVTQFANLPTNGSGIITSLEAGYPIPLPLGPRVMLEPQGQILWQHTSFRQAFDGLGEVALGSTSGVTGRLGLRAQSTIITAGGQVWQPYARANLWQNWGGAATTTFGVDQVPLLQESTQLEFAAGLTTKVNDLLSFYAQAGYEFAVGGDTNGGRRQGVTGDIGLRLTFGHPPPPLVAAPVAAPAPVATRSYLVFFDWDKATLTDRARQIIREAAENSTRVAYTRIAVDGHTDTSGTAHYNMGLSVRRARAVAGELVRDGVPSAAIFIRGFGQTNLLVPTGPGVREPQNRRVEIIIQ